MALEPKLPLVARGLSSTPCTTACCTRKWLSALSKNVLGAMSVKNHFFVTHVQSKNVVPERRWSSRNSVLGKDTPYHAHAANEPTRSRWKGVNIKRVFYRRRETIHTTDTQGADNREALRATNPIPVALTLQLVGCKYQQQLSHVFFCQAYTK